MRQGQVVNVFLQAAHGLCHFFFFVFKNVKTFLSSRAVQKQAGGWMWPLGPPFADPGWGSGLPGVPLCRWGRWELPLARRWDTWRAFDNHTTDNSSNYLAVFLSFALQQLWLLTLQLWKFRILWEKDIPLVIKMMCNYSINVLWPFSNDCIRVMLVL